MGKTIEEWETYFNTESSDILKEIINILETLQKAERASEDTLTTEEHEITMLPAILAIAKEVKRQRLEGQTKGSKPMKAVIFKRDKVIKIRYKESDNLNLLLDALRTVPGMELEEGKYGG